MATINISLSTTDYEFYCVPEGVAEAIITILRENNNSDIRLIESER